jgi:hypothetical protein
MTPLTVQAVFLQTKRPSGSRDRRVAPADELHMGVMSQRVFGRGSTAPGGAASSPPAALQRSLPKDPHLATSGSWNLPMNDPFHATRWMNGCSPFLSPTKKAAPPGGRCWWLAAITAARPAPDTPLRLLPSLRSACGACPESKQRIQQGPRTHILRDAAGPTSSSSRRSEGRAGAKQNPQPRLQK